MKRYIGLFWPLLGFMLLCCCNRTDAGEMVAYLSGKTEEGFCVSGLPWGSSVEEVQNLLEVAEEEWVVKTDAAHNAQVARRIKAISFESPKVSALEEYYFQDGGLYRKRLLMMAAVGEDAEREIAVTWNGVSYEMPVAENGQFEAICQELARQLEDAYGEPQMNRLEDVRSGENNGAVWWGEDGSQISVSFPTGSDEAIRMIDIQATKGRPNELPSGVRIG